MALYPVTGINKTTGDFVCIGMLFGTKDLCRDHAVNGDADMFHTVNGQTKIVES
jgi:hypothetical protein